MENFSGIGESFAQLEKRVADQADLRPAEPFNSKQSTPAATKKRVEHALRDFWFFDKTYYSPEQYQDYAAPSEYHKRIFDGIMRPGVTIHAGPRNFGKTAYAKKIYSWLLLTGKTHILGFLSYTLPNAQNILRDVTALIIDNDRIVRDFGVEFLEANSDAFAFRTLSKNVPSKKIRYGAAFSEGRSVRGYTRMFSRPERVYADDLETSVSPIGGEHTERRVRMIEEAFGSLGGTSPSLFCAGNNFDSRGFIASLLADQDKGVLGSKSNWKIEAHKAFSEASGSLWPSKFPAETEEAMRIMVGARTLADFNANWQQKPTPPEGHIFKRQYLKMWTEYPSDARGVIYTDQNLALKSKGDTTAIVRMTYSPSTENIYISAKCLSFSDPAALLDAALSMRSGTGRIVKLGMDGNVSQESHWRNHIRAWCKERKTLYPSVQFCRYSVDDLATNFQMIYNEGRVLFDPALAGSEEGIRFFEQFFAFVSKKDRRKDDAPDACICAYQLLTETNLNRRGGVGSYTALTIGD